MLRRKITLKQSSLAMLSWEKLLYAQSGLIELVALSPFLVEELIPIAQYGQPFQPNSEAFDDAKQ